MNFRGREDEDVDCQEEIENEFMLDGECEWSEGGNKDMGIETLRELKVEKNENKGVRFSSKLKINNEDGCIDLDPDSDSENDFVNLKINLTKKELISSQTEFAWNQENNDSNSSKNRIPTSKIDRIIKSEVVDNFFNAYDIDDTQQKGHNKKQRNNTEAYMRETKRKPVLKLVKIKKLITKLILNKSNTFKRIKTERSELKRSNDGDFVNIYKELKKCNPGLTVHSYFIACLHSAKETDMEIINKNGSDTNISFLIPN